MHILKSTLYYGPMKSGKSKALCEVVQNCMAEGLKFLIFKPHTDTRDKGYLKSRHYTSTHTAYMTHNTGEIINHYRKHQATVVIIDEIMFYPSDIIGVLDFFRLAGVEVYAGGLDKDFTGSWFPLADYAVTGLTMADLIPEFDNAYSLKASCDKCGKDATKTQRLINGRPAPKSSPTVVVGDSLYEARCERCYEEGLDLIPRAS